MHTKKDYTAIRLASHDDAARCADIHIRSWIFAYSNYISETTLERQNANRPLLWSKLLSNNQNTHYVIEADDKITGFFTINPSRDSDITDTYELTGLYLDPDYTGMGLGNLALSWINSEIAARGITRFPLGFWIKMPAQNHFMRKTAFFTTAPPKTAVWMTVWKSDIYATFKTNYLSPERMIL